ncbi:MAG: RES family NAD+ phosphorylase [Akkermansiaceae bacterium]|jgi:RES domain-containing protein|nr:RES family NAD+ phosphorylase [Akkermansiaceae bacterium]
MIAHPERSALGKRLAGKLEELAGAFTGTVFRFIGPKYSDVDEMFAGKGPLYADERWLAKGHCLATYTALLPETALAETLASTRYYGFPDAKSVPLVFVTAEAKLQQVIDLRDGKNRQRLRIAESAILDTDWRKENRNGKEAITQAWGWALHESGVEGFIVPSSANPGSSNLIAFPGNLKRSSHLKVLSEVDWPR